MEQEKIFDVVCRDGIPARVQRVPYEGLPKATVLMGYRVHSSMSREHGDIWYENGYWKEDKTPHAFDLISNAAKPAYAHG